MADALDILDEAIDSVTRLRKILSKNSSTQVSANAERDVVKATALAWIRQHRPELGERFAGQSLAACDAGFHELLDFSERMITRSKYKDRLKVLGKSLTSFRTDVLGSPAFGTPLQTGPPDWSLLVPDPTMQAILSRRWRETQLCLDAEASLAATVMMGAMLEALLLSRVNHLADRSHLFKTKSCPRDYKTKKPLPLQKWTLQHYIDVSHEMGWIRQAARDVGVVLRDYRNYIHPSKELSHGARIEKEDAEMFWIVFQSLANQITCSVAR